jgi:hypothetical protein
MALFSNRDDKVWYPSVVIDDIAFQVIADGEGNCVSVGVQLLFEVRYLVGKGKGGQGVLFLSFANGGGEALGNVEDSGQVVLVELHHMFGGGGRDGMRRGHRGPYGGQRANGHFDQSIDGNIGHFLGSVGVMVGAGVVLAEPGMDKGVIRRLIVDPQEEELSWLEIGLELKVDNFKGGGIGRERLWLGRDCLGKRMHSTMFDICMVFIEFCHWYCIIRSGV